MTTTGGKVFVDTNVLLRGTIEQFPLYKEARRLLDSYFTNGVELWISRQIIREYMVQSTRPQTVTYPMQIGDLEERLLTMQMVFRIADETAEVTAQLLQLLKQYPTGGKQVHDANIVATMLVNGVDTLLTMNVVDFQRFQDRITLIPLRADVP